MNCGLKPLDEKVPRVSWAGAVMAIEPELPCVHAQSYQSK